MWSRRFVAVFMILDVKYVLHKIIGLYTQHAIACIILFKWKYPRLQAYWFPGITVTMSINNIELIVSVRMLLEPCNQN